MPHVTVQVVPGHSEEEKRRLAEALHLAVQRELHTEGKWVSVSIQEVPSEQWPSFIRAVPGSSFYVPPAYLEEEQKEDTQEPV